MDEAIDRIRHMLRLVEVGEVPGTWDPFDGSVFRSQGVRFIFDDSSDFTVLPVPA
jgi:hypothetical protein